MLFSVGHATAPELERILQEMPMLDRAEPKVDTSPHVSNEVRKTTCYMCACRCGINVHLREGPNGAPMIRYIEGNRDHPVNRGVLCAKGSPQASCSTIPRHG